MRITLERGGLEAPLIQSPFEEGASMRKNSKLVPPAFKHGIYSAIGLLPTEDPAEFEKFKEEIFDDYKPVGRSEKIIVEEIACLQWRLQHLSTYGIAMRARERRSAIYSKLDPPQWFPPPLGIEPESRSPEELEALRKSLVKQVRTELGPAIELVEIGDVTTIEYLEKELGIRERLHGMIARLEKRLLYLRGIKSISPSSATSSPQPLLEAAE
jgi:hypothetical protein